MIPPRSRRSDTFAIATTGLRARPTTNRFVTFSTRRAATAVSTARVEPTTSGRAIFCCPRTVAVTALGSWFAAVDWVRPSDRFADPGRESNEPRTLLDAPAHRVGLAARVMALGLERHQKSRGPDLAHGSWFVWRAAPPHQASSRWAQISRWRAHRWVRSGAGRRCSASSGRPSPLAGRGRQLARRRAVYARCSRTVNPAE